MEPGVQEKEVKKIPYSQDAEMSVLGAMMLQPNSLYKAFSLLKAEDFYIDAHRKIFAAMEHLFNEKEAVDVLTVKEELKKRGELESIGGMEYLAELVESSITPALIDQHIEIVLEKSAFRKLIDVATRILDEAYKETMPADALIDLAEHLILTIRERRLKQDFESVGALVKDVFSEINELMLNKNLITGVPSGYRDLDRMTAGFQRGDLVVLASRPSMGKTS
ncbi:MAG: replicative DNA helicase, partial [Candidatus Hydrothermota bacterium]